MNRFVFNIVININKIISVIQIIIECVISNNFFFGTFMFPHERRVTWRKPPISVYMFYAIINRIKILIDSKISKFC